MSNNTKKLLLLDSANQIPTGESVNRWTKAAAADVTNFIKHIIICQGGKKNSPFSGSVQDDDDRVYLTSHDDLSAVMNLNPGFPCPSLGNPSGQKIALFQI